MTSATAIGSTVTAAFLASLVEVVEAFTIVLAVGLTRSWRPALIGSAAALGLLAVLVALFGPLFARIPLQLLQFAIGLLLILFGLRWLRKAILRAAGLIALHDEATAFARETDRLQREAARRRADWLAGAAAFKAVLLEGVEVVFVVIAVGTANGLTAYAAAGAAAAVALVLAVGAVLHRPLARVPENALKLAVGLMLASYGIFWTGEGLGADWPGADLALVGIFAILAGFSAAAVRLLRRHAEAAP